MVQAHDSFQQSPHGVFIQTPHRHARGSTVDLVFSGRWIFSFSDPTQNIFDMAYLKKGVVTEIGDNGEFDTGTDGSFQVSQIRVFKNKLYIIGNFGPDIGDQPETFTSVAKWNVTTRLWENLDVEDLQSNAFATDAAFYEDQNGLVVSSNSSLYNNDNDIGFLGLYNGTAWESMGVSAFGSPIFSTFVSTVSPWEGTVVASDYVDGTPNDDKIARYNGDLTWSPLADGIADPFNPTLMREVTFKLLEVSTTLLFITDNATIYTWDGVQYTLIGTTDTDSGFPRIYDIKPFDNGVVVCGRFDRIDSVEMLNVGFWDGEEWSPLGSGIDVTGAVGEDRVSQILDFQGALYAIGQFLLNGEGEECRHLAVYKPTLGKWVEAHEIDPDDEPLLNSFGHLAISEFSGNLDAKV